MSDEFFSNLDFAAWSVYTGPSGLNPVINDPDCPWIVGTWDAANANVSPVEIQKDIDVRINAVLDTIQRSLKPYQCQDRCFVIPEFFFRCKQGPYPLVKLEGGLYPFEYIRSQFEGMMKKVLPDDEAQYTIIIGSILTSNVEDYGTFLASEPVQERLRQLNDVLKGRANLSDEKGDKVWRRSLILETHRLRSNSELDELNLFMEGCRANPLCTVRNRGLCFCFKSGVSGGQEVFAYEKQCESKVDLTMGVYDGSGVLQTGGMITEWMANYPSYSIVKGDKHPLDNSDPYSTNARFTPSFFKGWDVGIEICLDHRLQRLKRTTGMCKVNGAEQDHYPLIKQFIPSGGMQILRYAAAGTKGAPIFNADGCDKIYFDYDDADPKDPSKAIPDATEYRKLTDKDVYAISFQSPWKCDDGNTYYSHSQLAFSMDDSAFASGFNNAQGRNNGNAVTHSGMSNPLTDRYVFSRTPAPSCDAKIFAAGTGEVHIYHPILDK